MTIEDPIGDAPIPFDELDITGVDSSTALIALHELEGFGWMLALALLADEQEKWVVYTTDLPGARRLRESLDSRITQLEEAIANDTD
jgi:hypothetical protein